MTATPAPTSHLVSCCHCSRTVSLRPEHLGQPVQCPHCGNYFQADPPALKQPAAKEWYILIDGKRIGPVSSKALVKLAAIGKLRPETWLTRGPSEVWVKAARIKGLKFGRTEVSARTGATQLPTQSSKDLVACVCPHCQGRCRISRPTTPAAFACPNCKQPFRAASTSVGIVCQRTLAALQDTVHDGTKTRMQ